MVLLRSTWATVALVSIAGAKPIAQVGQPDPSRAAQNCGLSATDPKSWKDSGAEKFLGDYIDTNGPMNWLQGISSANEGPNTVVVDCSTTSSNSCTAPTAPATCDKYEYFFARVMASNINSAFDSLDKKLTSQTIKDTLKMASVITDFDVVQDVPESETPGLLKNIALGPATISAVLGMAPGGAVFAGIFATIGAALGAAADNLEANKNEPKVPKYEDFAAAMGDRLEGFFSDTQSMLDKTLLAIFGDDSLSEKESSDLVRDMINRMSGLGVKDLNKDAKSPVSELLKGGELLTQIQDSKLNDALGKAFATVRTGAIGTLLARMQVYVEQEMPAYNEGEVQPCTALGTFKEGNSCHVIKVKPFDGSGAKPLDEKYLRKMGDYGIDLHTLIRNMRDCNNGQPDKSKILTDGSLPSCFYGMNFAQRVHEKDRKFQLSVVGGCVGCGTCINEFQNIKDVPEWIRGTCEHEIPKWGPCKVTFEETAYWTEAGLDRYRMGMIGEGVDISAACPYAKDGRRCVGGSNRQCYFNEDIKKWVIDINFAKGSIGHNDYKGCRDDIRSNFAKDNRCTAA